MTAGPTTIVRYEGVIRNHITPHLGKHQIRSLTLPWRLPEADGRTHRLLFTNSKDLAYNRSFFNQGDWKRALVAAGVIPPRTTGSQYFESAPDDGMHALRHAYASVLLDAGEMIKALAEYLGHSDPGFTLRTCMHLMPSSEARTRQAIDSVFVPAAASPTALPVAEHEADVHSTSPGQTEGKSSGMCTHCALAA